MLFLNQNVKTNYFTGEKDLTLDTKVSDARLMFNASDEVKLLSESGELKELHERYHQLKDASYDEYNQIRDRYAALILALNTKEDQIYHEVMQDYEGLSLIRHRNTADSILSVFTSRAFISIKNIQSIDKLKDTVDDKSNLRSYHEQLHALLEAQVQALKGMVELQQSWILNVENDAGTHNELGHFMQKRDTFSGFVHDHHETADSQIFVDQANELAQRVKVANSGFE
jgi:hypothetical protein